MRIIKVTDELKQRIIEDFSKKLNETKDYSKIEYKYEHKSDNSVQPKIVFTKDAYIKMWSLISACDGEVGWNGVVTRTDNTFTIEDILVYPQTVTGATVTCDEMETGMWLASFPTETFNKIRFQAHSHVNMGVTPSAVDREMYTKYEDTAIQDGDYYIFMICNKRNEFFVELYDTVTNAVYYKNDIKVEVEGITDFITESTKNIRKNTPQQQQNKPNQQSTTDNEFENCKDDCKKCTKRISCYDYYINRR